jgi:eukaryotic-like serine/threonine-protein kinase
MDQRWAHIAVFERAVDRRPAERASFVREASAGDSDLRRLVEGLLAEDGSRHLIDNDFPVEAVGWLADNSGVLAGATIGPFTVDRLIGVGGMGEVYRASDTKLGRDVAIKILPPGVCHRSRAARALQARSADPRVAQSPEHRGDSRIRGFRLRG